MRSNRCVNADTFETSDLVFDEVRKGEMRD